MKLSAVNSESFVACQAGQATLIFWMEKVAKLKSTKNDGGIKVVGS